MQAGFSNTWIRSELSDEVVSNSWKGGHGQVDSQPNICRHECRSVQFNFLPINASNQLLNYCFTQTSEKAWSGTECGDGRSGWCAGCRCFRSSETTRGCLDAVRGVSYGFISREGSQCSPHSQPQDGTLVPWGKDSPDNTSARAFYSPSWADLWTNFHICCSDGWVYSLAHGSFIQEQNGTAHK